LVGGSSPPGPTILIIRIDIKLDLELPLSCIVIFWRINQCLIS